MSGKGFKTSAGSIAGAGWQSSCNCMKSHRSSGQAWRGYERAAEVEIACNLFIIHIAFMMWLGFWLNWSDNLNFWLSDGCYLALLVYDCINCGWRLP